MKLKSFPFIIAAISATKNLCKLLLVLTAFSSLIQCSNNAQANTVSLGTPCINGLQIDINGGVDNGPTNLVWDWGDGQQAPGWFPQSHTYALAGQYTIKATAYYSGGAIASSSLTVQVGPGILSGNYSWTITAGQGGSISYQASVASGTVQTGESVTLQQAYAVGGNLTAIPSQGYSFAGWSASSDIWFNYGSANTPSVGAVVDGNSTITANFTNPFAPIVFTSAASAATANSATLNGSVNPNGFATAAIFQWGTTTAYGSSIPLSAISVGSDTSTHNVYSPTLTGLNPNTTYHFRLFASSSGGVSYGTDQAFTTAQIPLFDSNNLFVADSGSGNIYEFTTNGVRSTFASGLASPYGLAFNSAGDLFVSSWSGGGSVTEITPSGAQSVYASGFGYPIGLAFDSGGNLFVANAGGPNEPIGVVFDSSNDEFVSNLGNGTITEIAPDGTQSTFASGLGSPLALAFNSAGNLFVGEYGSGYIYEFTPSGVKSTFASGVYECQGLAFDSAGDLFADEYDLSQIIEITPSGAQSTFASGLAGPYGLAFPPSSPPTVNALVSGLIVTPSSALANGSSQITATVTLLDGNYHPLSGKQVIFSINQPNPNPLFQPKFSNGLVIPTTDASGHVTVNITSTYPGSGTLIAIDLSDSVIIQQQQPIQFTGTFVPPDTTLANSIQNLYTGTAFFLDGTFNSPIPSLPFSFLSNLSFEPIRYISTDEGNVGDSFEVAANNAQFAEKMDAVFGFVGGALSAGDEPIAKSVVLALGLAAENSAVDNINWIATNSDGLRMESQAVLNVNTANQTTLLGQESALSLVPQTSADMTSSYTNDLQLRLMADYILVNALFNEDTMLDNLNAAANTAALENDELEVAETAGGIILTIATGGAALPVLIVVNGGYALTTTTLNEQVDNQSFTDNQKAYLYAFSAMQSCADYSLQIYSNSVSAFSQIEQGVAPSPVTGAIVGLQPAIQCTLGSIPSNPQSNFQPHAPSGGGTETTTYQSITIPSYASSSLTVSNAGSAQATFEAFAFYNSEANGFNANTSISLVDVTAMNIGGQQSGLLLINYVGIDDAGNSFGARPAEGSTVSIYVLGINDTGTFYVATTNFVWSAEAGSPCSLGGAISTPGAKVKPLDDPTPTTNNTYIIDNPIRTYIAQQPATQTYKANLWTENPFFGPLLAIVTQPIPAGVTVLSTDGTLQDSSIIWTNVIAASNAVESTFTFSLTTVPGAPTNLPAASVVFIDTNTFDSLTLESSTPYFTGLFPVQVSSSIPAGVLGVDSTMLVAVTNLTGASQSGSLTVTLTDSSGNPVTNFLESFSLDGSGSTNLSFTWPGSLPVGSYSLTGSLSVNGGAGQVLAGNYVVPAPPIVLAPASATALTGNGFNMALQGTAGNYLIEASSDICTHQLAAGFILFHH